MNKKAKMIVAIAIVAVAFGAFLMLPPALALEEVSNTENTSGPNTLRPITKLKLIIYVLRNGVPTDFEASTVLLEGNILVVEIDGETLNINMPGRWVFDGRPIPLQDLFDGNPIGPGKMLNIKSLKLEMSKDSHKVTSYFAYEITFDDSTASAILPFNIES
jgi:hypothetical protein